MLQYDRIDIVSEICTNGVEIYNHALKTKHLVADSMSVYDSILW